MAKKDRIHLAKAIGERVKQLRHYLGISQMDIVRKTGFSSATLSEIESGNRLAGVDFVAAIVESYGVNPNWVIFGTGEMIITSGEIQPVNVRPDPSTVIQTLQDFEERLRKLEAQDKPKPKPRVRKGFQ